LQELNRLYETDEFQMVVIYGRRRVGKTWLIQHFCQEKPAILYVAIEQNDQGALMSFSKQVLEAFPAAKSYLDNFSTWEKCFDYIAEQAKDTRLIVAIDEYPYMAMSNPSISSIIQKVIDTKLLQSRLFLILCGSSMSFMEHQVLGYQSPLYGRRTAQFKIEPFDYYTSSRFYSQNEAYSDEDKLVAYGITGGIPQYLHLIAKYDSLEESIYRNFFRKDGHLFEEPNSILKQELREPAVYNSIIKAIADGASKLNDIAMKSGEDNKKCSRYLSALIDLHMVKKEYPIGSSLSRNGVYALKDTMFRFWYRYVPNYITNIEAGMGEIIVKKKVIPTISEYMGKVFEDICMQYLIHRNKALKLPFMFDQIGRWWGNNPHKRRQEEIDILAISDRSAIVCECKWRNEPVGLDVLYALKEKSISLSSYQSFYYFIFSKKGFKKELIELSGSDPSIELIDLQRIMNLS